MADPQESNVTDGVPEPTKEALLELIERGRADWFEMLVRAGGRVGEAGAAGEWTLRDVQAHINAYHRFLIGELGGHVRSLGDMPESIGMDVQKRNAWMHEQDLGESWEFVVSEAEALHQQLIDMVGRWTEDDLRQQMVPWQPWPRWRWIISLTSGHYEEHNPALEQWLSGHTQA